MYWTFFIYTAVAHILLCAFLEGKIVFAQNGPSNNSTVYLKVVDLRKSSNGAENNELCKSKTMSGDVSYDDVFPVCVCVCVLLISCDDAVKTQALKCVCDVR